MHEPSGLTRKHDLLSRSSAVSVLESCKEWRGGRARTQVPRRQPTPWTPEMEVQSWPSPTAAHPPHEASWRDVCRIVVAVVRRGSEPRGDGQGKAGLTSMHSNESDSIETGHAVSLSAAPDPSARPRTDRTPSKTPDARQCFSSSVERLYPPFAWFGVRPRGPCGWVLGRWFNAWLGP